MSVAAPRAVLVSWIAITLVAAALGSGSVPAAGGVARQCISDPESAALGYSTMNITSGERIVWLAGTTATRDRNGKSLAGDFEAQTRESFRILQKRLEQVGGTLADVASMTVYVKDTRHNAEFVSIRKQMFNTECLPASALIVVSGLAAPDILIEIQAVAVLPN